MWTQDIQSGAHSDARSWSVLLAGLVDKASSVPEKDAPQAWAWGSHQPRSRTHRPPTLWSSPARRNQARSESSPTPRKSPPAWPRCQPATSASTPCSPHPAHRGGSLSWPEASMRAYTAAVTHGIGAPEISCQQTADGIWVLNHDQTLQRVDPTAPNTPVIQTTWAQVQTYRTQGEPSIRIEQVPRRLRQLPRHRPEPHQVLSHQLASSRGPAARGCQGAGDLEVQY